MSFRFSRSGFSLALLACGVAGLFACRAQGQEQRPGGKTEAAGVARNSQSSTNSNPFNSKKDGLKQLEKDLSRSFQSFSFKDSMDSLIEPPPRALVGPVMQNTRVREILERRKNWMNLSPDDLLMPGTDERLFKTFENKQSGAEKKSSLEQFYDELNRPRGKGGKSGGMETDEFGNSQKRKSPREEQGSDDDSNLPSGIRERERELKKLLGGDTPGSAFSSAPARSSFADIFGLGSDHTGPTKAEVLAHKAYMEKYQQLLAGPTPAASSGVNPLGGFDTTTRAPGYTGLGSFAGPSRTETSLPGANNPLANPVAQPDINARLLNQWNPFYAPPKVEAPRIAPLTTPVTEIPKRKF